MSLPRLPQLLLFCATLASAVVARAAIEFTGILATPQKKLFALTDTETGKTEWVGIGQMFAGYKVASFNAKLETLLLQQTNAGLEIHLKDDAKIKSVGLEFDGTFTIGQGEKLEVIRTQFEFERETLLPLKDGLSVLMTLRRRPDGNIRIDAKFERTAVDGEKTRLAAPSLIVRPGQQFAFASGDISLSYKPN